MVKPRMRDWFIGHVQLKAGLRPVRRLRAAIDEHVVPRLIPVGLRVVFPVPRGRGLARPVDRDHDAAMRFLRSVDASCVLINASTRFNDGFQLGMGAEIGISTSRVHAYGPMGLEELTSQRFVVEGAGHVR